MQRIVEGMLVFDRLLVNPSGLDLVGQRNSPETAFFHSPVWLAEPASRNSYMQTSQLKVIKIK